jgi:hypothetical protein
MATRVGNHIKCARGSLYGESLSRQSEHFVYPPRDNWFPLREPLRPLTDFGKLRSAHAAHVPCFGGMGTAAPET